MYRGFVDFGFHDSPDFVAKAHLTLRSDLLKREAVFNKNRKAMTWTNVTDDFYENCDFIRGSQYSFDNLSIAAGQGKEKHYSVQHFVDLNSVKEVTVVLYFQEEEKNTVTFQADEQAILVLVNNTEKAIAHVMKPARKAQRIVCVSYPRL